MKNVEIDLEKAQVTTSVSLSTTFDELAEYYNGNSGVLTHTFPLLQLGQEQKNLEKRFVGEEAGMHYYTFYPWTIILTKLKDE